MNNNRNISIWDDVPVRWQEPEKAAPTEPTPPQPVPAPEEMPAPQPPLPAIPAPAEPQKTEKREEKKKYRKFQRRNEDARENASESTRKAYRAERRGNQKDFLILGLVLLLTACVIGGLLYGSSRIETERVYALIGQGNYSTAYQKLLELAREGENVDDLVYAFSQTCADDSEYKRAVAALELLSAEAEENPEFFRELVRTLISHRKAVRARDVLEYLYAAGGTLSTLADELILEYPELSGTNP